MTPRPAKAEIFAEKKKSRSITVEAAERACVNCIWYEQYFRMNRGNVRLWIPTSTGFCLMRDRRRGALERACADFERKEI